MPRSSQADPKPHGHFDRRIRRRRHPWPISTDALPDDRGRILAGLAREGHRSGNWGFAVLVRALYGGRYSDLCDGYAGFWKSVLPVLDLDSSGFEIEGGPSSAAEAHADDVATPGRRRSAERRLVVAAGPLDPGPAV